MRLPRTAYRAVITVHVAASVAWLGLSLSLLVLAVAVLTADTGADQAAASTAADLVASALALPFGATALASGLVLAAGTRWTLRYGWVQVKLAATAVTFGLTLALLRPGLARLAGEVGPDRLVAPDEGIVFGPVVSSSVFVALIALSYVKPVRRSGRGRRPAPARSIR